MGFFSRNKKENSVIGIDIGSSTIKVVQLSKKKGKAYLDTYGAISLGTYSEEEIGKATNLTAEKLIPALTDILKEAKTTSKKGGVAISFSSSLIISLDLPASSEKHLKEIVPMEAKKYVPIPMNEVVLDWSVVSKYNTKRVQNISNNESGNNQLNYFDQSKEGKEGDDIEMIKVLVVAIHSDIIKKFKNIVSSTSLSAGFFEIEIFSALRSVLEIKDAPTAILDIGAATTKVYIIENGNVEKSHAINRGSQHITSSIARSLAISVKEAEVLKRTKGLLPSGDKHLREAIMVQLDYIFNETLNVIKNYQEKNNKIVKKAILIGGGGLMHGLAKVASMSLQIDVLRGDPFNKIEAPAFVNQILKDIGPEYSVALGIAIRGLEE